LNPAYERVYHYHVRKTAGTSLNAAFWALAGLDYKAMSNRQVAEGNGLKILQGGAKLIPEGDYFFASSHQPAYRLWLPPSTFTITILRDPASRVISYFSYLLWAKGSDEAREAEPFIDNVIAESAVLDGGVGYTLRQLAPRRLSTEKSLISEFGLRNFVARLTPRRESAFRNFLAHVPPHHLWSQLHMFSERLDPAEAAEKILACSAVCFTETFSEDLKRIGSSLRLNLEERGERRFGEKAVLSTAEAQLLRDRLTPEYEMIDLVRKGLRGRY
jgi:hypothetical protein